MQERNFEKQVQQKMEELSLTPSEPVWKKIDAQLRKKRDRRRLFFWLPLAVLLIGGGIWYGTTQVNKGNSIAKAVIIQDKKDGIEPEVRKEISTENTTVDNRVKPIGNDKKNDVFEGKWQEQDHTLRQPEQQLQVSPTVKTGENLLLQNSNRNSSSVKRTISRKKEGIGVQNKSVLVDDAQKNNFSKRNTEVAIESLPKQQDITGDNLIDNPSDKKNAAKEDNLLNADTSFKAEPLATPKETDSLAIENSIVHNSRRSVNTKWRLAIEAGIFSSGVNNGFELFGGAKSLETNAFARDATFSSFVPNNSPAAVYRAPSTQRKSGSFLFGVRAKKQLSKRWFLSTGLRYDFYSTRMQVGQKVQRDTVVELNKTVANYYSNSGSNFSDYQNQFHFISVPVSFDFKLLNKLPLDIHIGLSLQQLVHTNALMYSSVSQVYYNDPQAFNKTYLFSDLGLEYSFSLAKNFLLKVGPRVNYSHSKVIKASDRHLFSYGLVTQLVFLKN